jgi:hypothetical protein
VTDREIEEAVVRAYAGESFRVELSAIAPARRRRQVVLAVAAATAVAALVGALLVGGVFRAAPVTPGRPAPTTVLPTEGPSPVPGGGIIPVGQRDVLCSQQAVPDPGPPVVFKDDEGPRWIQLSVSAHMAMPCMQLDGGAVTRCCGIFGDPSAPGPFSAPLDFLAMSDDQGRVSWVIGRAPQGAELVWVSRAGDPTPHPAQLHDGYFFLFLPYVGDLDQHPDSITVTAYTSTKIYTKTGPRGTVTATPR